MGTDEVKHTESFTASNGDDITLAINDGEATFTYDENSDNYRGNTLNESDLYKLMLMTQRAYGFASDKSTS